MRSSVRAAIVAALALTGLVGRPARAQDPPAPAPASPVPPPPTLAVPRVEGLVLDGKLAEAGWAAAVEVPSEPPAPATDPKAKPAPKTTVRVAASAGRLWIAVEVAEAFGFPCGLRGFVAAEGTASVADATGFAYAPQDTRGPRYVARGAAGDGREAYRVVGATDASQVGRWTVEVAIPFEDLRLPSDATPLRLAVAAARRVPNVVVAAPPGSAFAMLDAFARLTPPEGGWAAGAKVEVDGKALAAEDAADKQRIGHWQAFLKVFGEAMRGGAGVKADILAPLDAAIVARPDLAVLRLARGEVLDKLGDPAGAKAAFAEGLALVPTMPEAQWAVAQLEMGAWIEPPDTEPSDYDAMLGRLATIRAGRAPNDPGTTLAEAVLRFRRGEFVAAVPLFDAVLGAFPVGEDTLAMAAASRRYQEAFAQELSFRRKDEATKLPRARLETSKGVFVVELFEDDAPNTVANFVWLADAKFYDGTVFHRVVPFFMAQGGDPFSGRDADARVGKGGPGYAIPTEANRRLPFRGVIAMAHARRDTEGSQFFLTTGTSPHLEREYTVFGRVLEGQDVADRLVRGDRLVKVEVTARREHPYRPTTVAGTPAPAPTPSAPPAPPPPPAPGTAPAPR